MWAILCGTGNLPAPTLPEKSDSPFLSSHKLLTLAGLLLYKLCAGGYELICTYHILSCHVQETEFHSSPPILWLCYSFYFCEVPYSLEVYINDLSQLGTQSYLSSAPQSVTNLCINYCSLQKVASLEIAKDNIHLWV